MKETECIAGTTFERQSPPRGGISKVKIGVTVPVTTVLFMEVVEQHGYTAGRSDFVSQALTLYMAYLIEKFHLEELLGEEVKAFKALYPQETDALKLFHFLSTPKL